MPVSFYKGSFLPIPAVTGNKQSKLDAFHTCFIFKLSVIEEYTEMYNKNFTNSSLNFILAVNDLTEHMSTGSY